MTAENQNEESQNEGPDQHNLSIQGNVDESTIVLGDRNTIHQGPRYYTTNVFSPVNAGNGTDSRLNTAQNIQESLTQINADVSYTNVHSPLQVFQSTGQQSDEAVSQPSRQEYRQRQVLITKVRTFWVEDVLERSLHAKALIELGLEKRFDAVQHPFESLEDTVADSESDPLPLGSQVEEVFTNLGLGRTLLILGEPGSGKTTMLLKLTKNLIIQAENNASLPIPVVFNLSSWTSPQQSIVAWLVEELSTKYQVSKPLAQTWIDNQSMLLLLDGLDEVATGLQGDCVRAINQFLHHHGQTETAVCSRIKDYLALPERLQLRSALYLQPLTNDQIHQYLDKAGSQLEAVKTLLKEDAALQELARSPLILSIMTLAYQGKSLADIPQTGSLEEQRRHLLEVYVKRMFQRKGLRRTYPDEKVIRWLTWLAKQMVRNSQTVFLIESVQPDWLPTKLDRRFYGIGIRIVLIVLWGAVHVGMLAGHGEVKTTFEFDNAARGILIGAGGGMVSGLISGATSGLLQGIWSRLLNGLILAAIFGPIFALTYTGGVAFACIYAALGIYLVEPLQRPIEPVEISRISWDKIRNYFALGIVVAIALYLGTGSPWRPSILIGLATVLMFGFERVNRVEEVTVPNQGMWKTASNVGRNVALFMPLFGLLFWLGIGSSIVSGVVNGIIVGVAGGLIGAQNSGIVCIKHVVLRTLLCRSGVAPRDYAHFLDYATDRIFIQRVGGGYIFVHRLLLEHFASLEAPSNTSRHRQQST